MIDFSVISLSCHEVIRGMKGNCCYAYKKDGPKKDRPDPVLKDSEQGTSGICFISLLQLFRLYASTTMDKKEKREKENKTSARISSRTNTPENSHLYAEHPIACIKARLREVLV